MMNHFYQIIKSKNFFTIHEYMYGIKSQSTMYNIEELYRRTQCLPGHFKAIQTISTTDQTVKANSDFKHSSTYDKGKTK